MANYVIPGVYREEIVLRDERLQLPTGVCGFIGGATSGPTDPRTGVAIFYQPVALRGYDEFRAAFGGSNAFLADAIDGFFANGGSLCYVIRTNPEHDAQRQIRDGLAALATNEAVDLICAPDIVAGAPTDPLLLPAYRDQVSQLQRTILEYCARSNSAFAILDAPPGSNLAQLETHRRQLSSRFGALYYPWIVPWPGRIVPPSGYVAGIYARTDNASGVFRAPANQEVVGVQDLVPSLDATTQGALSTAGINALRALPGRGIRVMGSRTLAGPQQPEWSQISVSRLFLTVGRWLDRALRGLSFEPNELQLWARTRREIGSYLLDLWRQGALMGDRAEDAFYVQCDAATNPPETRDAGMLIAEIGLAPIVPAEFVVARIVQQDGQTVLV